MALWLLFDSLDFPTFKFDHFGLSFPAQLRPHQPSVMQHLSDDATRAFPIPHHDLNSFSTSEPVSSFNKISDRIEQTYKSPETQQWPNYSHSQPRSKRPFFLEMPHNGQRHSHGNGKECYCHQTFSLLMAQETAFWMGNEFHLCEFKGRPSPFETFGILKPRDAEFS